MGLGFGYPGLRSPVNEKIITCLYFSSRRSLHYLPHARSTHDGSHPPRSHRISSSTMPWLWRGHRKRKRQGMLKFFQAVETSARSFHPALPILPQLLTNSIYRNPIAPPLSGMYNWRSLKLNIEDKEQSLLRGQNRADYRRQRHTAC